MSFLSRMLSRRPGSATGMGQAVLVHLDGEGLPDQVYEDHDVSTLEAQLERAVQDGALGEVDGHESGPGETTVYLYGPDAEKLFAGVEAVLRRNPLCQGARVVIRRGAPGAEARVVVL
jgi:hypothetical protein